MHLSKIVFSPVPSCLVADHCWDSVSLAISDYAYRFEVMRALRKGQASAFNVTRDIRGEARIVERAFGLGASALAEAVQLVNARLAFEAA